MFSALFYCVSGKAYGIMGYMNPSYDNSFGSFGSSGVGGASFGAPVVSSGGGGVVSGGQNKAKKIVVVVVLFLLVVALFCGVIYFTMSKDKGGVSNVITGDAYLRYANYLLYGEDKDTKIGESVSWTVNRGSGVLEIYDPEFDDKEYVDKLIDLYDGFQEDFGKSSMNEDEILSSVVSVVKDKLEGLREYVSVDHIALENMVEEYLDGRNRDIVKWVTDNYATVINSKNDDVREYVGLKIEQAKEMVVVYDIYADGGCISDGRVDLECINNIEGINEVGTKLLENNELVSDAENHIVYDILSISEMLYKSINEERTGAE